MSNTEDFMLTTFDNPFNPHSHFKEWFAYDTELGHNTSSLLARVTFSSSEFPESWQKSLMNLAIDEVISEDLLGIYRKILPNEVPIVVKE